MWRKIQNSSHLSLWPQFVPTHKCVHTLYIQAYVHTHAHATDTYTHEQSLWGYKFCCWYLSSCWQALPSPSHLQLEGNDYVGAEWNKDSWNASTFQPHFFPPLGETVDQGWWLWVEHELGILTRVDPEGHGSKALQPHGIIAKLRESLGSEESWELWGVHWNMLLSNISLYLDIPKIIAFISAPSLACLFVSGMRAGTRWVGLSLGHYCLSLGAFGQWQRAVHIARLSIGCVTDICSSGQGWYRHRITPHIE